MRSRIIVNLLLIAGIVLLGVIARYEPGIEAPAESAAITSLKAADVHRIHINRPLRDDLVLRREAPQHWQLERAVALPADNFKVNALLRLAEQQPQRSYPVAGMDLEALQLDPPYASVIVDDTAIEFGSLEPINRLRYVRVRDHVYLIPANYLPLIEARFTQFVRPRLFDAQAHIQTIKLPGLNLARDDKGWHAEPAQPVSADVLQQFADIWQSASGLTIQPADPEQSGEPVEIHLQGQSEPVMLQIIKREPELVLSRPAWGIQYVMGNRGEAMLSLDAAKADLAD